jgi:hypothetical protein
MSSNRLPWNSSLQNPFLAAVALVAVLISLIFNFSQPGWISGLALALTGFSLAGLGYLEYRHFRSIKRAYNLAMLAAHDGFWEWNPVTKQLLECVDICDQGTVHKWIIVFTFCLLSWKQDAKIVVAR